MREERGFAIVLTALVLVVIVGATAVAVDLGSRYALAARIQRAADAAALAGVAVLPNGLGQAQAEARQVAARNGFGHDPANGITVDVSELGPESLQVQIVQDPVPEYFGSLFGGPDSVTRRSTARYVRAVSLGSPRNFLGTGDLIGTDSGGDMRWLANYPTTSSGQTQSRNLQERYWLAISGECSSRENGDRFNALTTANYTSTGSWDRCEGGSTVPNLEYRDYGYIYAVYVPPGYASGTIDIQAFDPAICNSSRPGDPSNASTGGMDTVVRVRTGSTDPLAGGTVLSTQTFPRSSAGCNSWTTLATLSPPVADSTYFIQVDAGRNTGGGSYSNGFALRASVRANNTSGRFWACSSDPTDLLHVATCPQVYAVGDMGVFASLSGTRAEFFLAQIGDEYSSKEMEISLFDPGEGARTLRLKSPSGGYVGFRWAVDCSGGVTPPTGGCSGTASASGGLDLSGGGHPQPGPRRSSDSKYNDRLLTLTVALPDDIAGDYGGRTWWKVEYEVGDSPSDRTTWSVEVNGDPVRLLPNP